MIVGNLNILLPPSMLLLVVVAAGWLFYSEYSFVSVVAWLNSAVSPMLTAPVCCRRPGVTCMLSLIATSSLFFFAVTPAVTARCTSTVESHDCFYNRQFCRCPGVTCYCWSPSPPVDCCLFLLRLLTTHALLAPKPRLFLQTLLPWLIVAFITYCSLLQNASLHWHRRQKPLLFLQQSSSSPPADC